MKNILYKYNEKILLEEIQKYVDATYAQHYSTSKIQAMEMINDMGDGISFCRGAVVKYLQRYGKKDGFNRKDILKSIHYLLIMLSEHDKLHGEDV